MLIATRHCTTPFLQWSRWARCSIVSGKAQQLAKAHSMHSIHIFCTNGLNKVYIVFRASVCAITRCSLCRFFMPSATHHCTIPFTQWSRRARRSIVSGKAQQLAKERSMHSIHIFCTNGLNKVYIIFRASVLAITRCSFCSFFMHMATHHCTIPSAQWSRRPSVQVCPKSCPFPVRNSIFAMIHIKVWQSFHIWQLQQFQSMSYLYT